MDNNDFFRRLRYILDYDDSEMIQTFKLADLQVKRSELSDWLKREDEETFQKLSDINLANFLNGLIIKKRGKQEGKTPKPEKSLNNNIVFKKLRIAFNLRSENIVSLYKAIDKHISEHELSSFMRKPSHPKYKACNDQYLRHFLNGLQHKFRKPEEKSTLMKYKKK